MSSALQKRTQTLGKMLNDNIKQITSLLPSGMDVKRLCRISLNAVAKNPKLAECKPETFLLAVMAAGEMGLEPTLGHCALIPYKGVVQCQPMYQGLIDIARRSGKISMIYAEVVREGDEFEYELGLEPKLVHKPKPDNKGDLMYAYAVAKLTDGSKQFAVLDKEAVTKRRNASQSKDSPAWKDWEEEMWKKSAIKSLYKMLPKSTEMAKALDLDNRTEAGKISIPDVDLADVGIDVAEVAEAGEGEGAIEPPKAKDQGKPEQEEMPL